MHAITIEGIQLMRLGKSLDVRSRWKKEDKDECGTLVQLTRTIAFPKIDRK